jgi:phosphoglycolate phosphatase
MLAQKVQPAPVPERVTYLLFAIQLQGLCSMQSATPTRQADDRRDPFVDPSSSAALTNIVFDLDGTLIDSAPGIAASLAHALRAAGRPFAEPSIDAIRKAIGPPIRVIARRIEPSLTDDELTRIEPAYRADYDTRGWRQTVLYDDVAEKLASLRSQGLRLFIVTNKPHLPTRNILDHLQLGALFEATLSRDSQSPAFTSKSAMLSTLLQTNTLNPAATLMVGDTSEDQEAAHHNAMRFLHVTYGYGSLTAPAPAISRFAELPGFLQQQR